MAKKRDQKEQKEMAGDYEVLQKMRLGGKVLIFGHNPNDAEAPYMTCYQQPGFWGGYMYPDAVGSADYFEIMQTFLSRLQEQAKVVEKFREERNLPLTTLNYEHCRKRGAEENLEGHLIILRSTSLAPEYRTSDCQLGFTLGGFGCTPGAGGSAVYFEELYSVTIAVGRLVMCLALPTMTNCPIGQRKSWPSVKHSVPHQRKEVKTMERKDVMSLAYDEVRIFDMPALFTEWRVIRDSVPEGMNLYELRHISDDWGEPCQVAKGVVVNYYGSILTSLPIQLNPDGGRDMEHGDLHHKGERRIKIPAFLEKNPVAELDVMNLKILDQVEENLFFSMDEQADRRNGCIGHFRGDFGSGKQFYHNWFPHQNNRLNKEPFKSDFQRVVDWLRQDYSPLKDLDSMAAFCRRHEPYSKMTKAIVPSHGFRIDTKRFQYMLRCFPEKGDYNFYIYCYDKQAREQERTEPTKKAKKKHEPER